MEPSIFTQIINGDIPCHKVYEDELTFTFMDINPVTPGMVVVASKEQTDNFEELSADMYAGLWLSVQKVSKALKQAFPDAAKVAVQVEGLEVAHAHVKLFPFSSAVEFHASASGAEPNHEELAKISDKIRSFL